MATYSRKLKDSSGNYICPVTRAEMVYFSDNSKLNKLTSYPVGSIYMSASSTSPASLFGGSWEQIKEKFLFGTGSTYTLGTIGGEERTILDWGSMPEHLHNLYTQDPGDDLGYKSESKTVFKPGTIAWSDYYREVGSVMTNTGRSDSHNNMPPYEVVNIWKRTA